MSETELYMILSHVLPDGNEIGFYLSKINLIDRDYEELGIPINRWSELRPEHVLDLAQNEFLNILIEKIIAVSEENMTRSERNRALNSPFPSGAYLIDYIEDCLPNDAGLKALGIDTLGYWDETLREEMHEDFYSLLLENIVMAARINNV